jgi:hypothetical protein
MAFGKGFFNVGKCVHVSEFENGKIIGNPVKYI